MGESYREIGIYRKWGRIVSCDMWGKVREKVLGLFKEQC